MLFSQSPFSLPSRASEIVKADRQSKKSAELFGRGKTAVVSLFPFSLSLSFLSLATRDGRQDGRTNHSHYLG